MPPTNETCRKHCHPTYKLRQGQSRSSAFPTQEWRQSLTQLDRHLPGRDQERNCTVPPVRTQGSGVAARSALKEEPSTGALCLPSWLINTNELSLPDRKKPSLLAQPPSLSHAGHDLPVHPHLPPRWTPCPFLTQHTIPQVAPHPLGLSDFLGAVPSASQCPSLLLHVLSSFALLRPSSEVTPICAGVSSSSHLGPLLFLLPPPPHFLGDTRNTSVSTLQHNNNVKGHDSMCYLSSSVKAIVSLLSVLEPSM